MAMGILLHGKGQLITAWNSVDRYVILSNSSCKEAPLGPIHERTNYAHIPPRMDDGDS